MTVDWGDPDVVERFDALEGLTERVVGVPALHRELRLGTDDVRRVLDFGCGPGRTAREIADEYGVAVTGVDRSAEMLRLATRDRRPLIDYQLTATTADPLVFLADASIDAAWSCFVFTHVADVAELRRIATAVRRVLRPGGRYVLMESNPAAIGVRFASFQTGEPGRCYRPGEARSVRLYGPRAGLEFTDHHWPAFTYREVLAYAGFARISTIRPCATPEQAKRIATRTGAAAVAESEHAPLLIVVADSD